METAIIIPVYNGILALGRCLESLKLQTYKNFKIILVDDGSKEDIACCIGKYNIENILYIRKENEGASLAREYGLQFVEEKTKYIIFIDSDDYIEPNYLQMLTQSMEKDNLDFCQYSFFMDTEKKSKKYRYPEREIILEGLNIDNFIFELFGSYPDRKAVQKYSVAVWGCCFKYELIKQRNIHFQSERKILSEDTLFKIDYLKCCTRIGLYPHTGYHYTVSDVSLSHRYYSNKSQLVVAFYNELVNRISPSWQMDEMMQRIYRKILMYFNNDILKIIQSKVNHKDKIKYIKQIIDLEVYKNSVLEIKTRKLNLKNMIFNILTRNKMVRVIIVLGRLYGR